MHETKVFYDPEFGQVRVLEINGKPWFVGKDVALALGYSNPRKAIIDHVDEEDKWKEGCVTIRDSIGRAQQPTIINESGLYSLTFSCKRPCAKRFRQWVTDEILPAVRTSANKVSGKEEEHISYNKPSILPKNNNILGAVEIVDGVECYEKDGVVYLKLEAVARGLGFTQTQIKNGIEYESIRWETVFRYLDEIIFPNKLGKSDFIPENIFYRLAMKAKNAAAEAFQAKIADEVIPSIRKHGAYMTPETLEAAILNPDTLLKIALELKKERDKRIALEAENRSLVADIEALTPKADYYDALVEKNVLTSLRETAKEFQIGEKMFIAWLLEHKYIYRAKSGKLLPYAHRERQGLFETKEYCGETWSGVQTMITPKGRKTLLPLVMELRKPQEEYDVNQICIFK